MEDVCFGTIDISIATFFVFLGFEFLTQKNKTSGDGRKKRRTFLVFLLLFCDFANLCSSCQQNLNFFYITRQPNAKKKLDSKPFGKILFSFFFGIFDWMWS